VREVSDGFLFSVAEVSATLLGLFVVGIFFFADSAFRRPDRDDEVVQPYFRAGTRIVMVLYAVPLGLSLTLVVLEPIWTRILFLVLSLMLVAANVDTASRIRTFARVTGSSAFRLNEVVGTLLVLALVVIPWALGGLHPGREDFAWAILLSLVAGFLSTTTVVLSVFDIARIEAGTGGEDAGERTR
jgi:hypothetical protein